MQYFNGNYENVTEEYDMNDPKQRKQGILVAIAIFVPLLLLGGAGAYAICEGSIIAAVILIFLAVFTAMIGCVNTIIYNLKNTDGYVDEDKIRSLKVIRSIMIIIAGCATYIPFLPYICALIAARKYPEASFYGKGMNAQIFTLLWSIISLIMIVLVIIILKSNI